MSRRCAVAAFNLGSWQREPRRCSAVGGHVGSEITCRCGRQVTSSATPRLVTAVRSKQSSCSSCRPRSEGSPASVTCVLLSDSFFNLHNDAHATLPSVSPPLASGQNKTTCFCDDPRARQRVGITCSWWRAGGLPGPWPACSQSGPALRAETAERGRTALCLSPSGVQAGSAESTLYLEGKHKPFYFVDSLINHRPHVSRVSCHQVPEIICSTWSPSATGIPAKLRDIRPGCVARCSREPSVTHVPSRLRVCRLDSPAKADTSLTWPNETAREDP